MIPARDAAGTIGEQLEALAGQVTDIAWEVLVADNGSADRTSEVVSAYANRLPALRIVDASTRIGINAARNAGIREARGAYIVLCDADDVVAPGWIAAMRAALDHHDLVTGPLDERTLNASHVARIRVPFPADRLPVAGGFLPYGIGCNLGFRRDVWDRLGGFDETWIRGGEEVEFCWRAQLTGFSLGFAGDAVVAYRYRPEVGAVLRQVARFAEGQPHLYRAFRHAGMPRSRTWSGVKGWLWLACRFLDLQRDDDRRAAWLRRLAQRYGFLRGSVRARVLYL